MRIQGKESKEKCKENIQRKEKKRRCIMCHGFVYPKI
jgi:hypothetical protein